MLRKRWSLVDTKGINPGVFKIRLLKPNENLSFENKKPWIHVMFLYFPSMGYIVVDNLQYVMNPTFRKIWSFLGMFFILVKWKPKNCNWVSFNSNNICLLKVIMAFSIFFIYLFPLSVSSENFYFNLKMYCITEWISWSGLNEFFGKVLMYSSQLPYWEVLRCLRQLSPELEQLWRSEWLMSAPRRSPIQPLTQSNVA